MKGIVLLFEVVDYFAFFFFFPGEVNYESTSLPLRPSRTNLRVLEINDEANLVFNVDGRIKWLIIKSKKKKQNNRLRKHFQLQSVREND